jgi:cysteine desulfurase
MERKVYLDSAATTYVSTEVLNEMMPCFNVFYGNANSIHSFGREAQGLVDRARDRIAKIVGAKSNEIYFTSGGTEANNWAIKGIAKANQSKGKHIITSQIEHPSVLDSCKKLEKEGFEVTYLPVDKYGVVSIAELLHVIRPDTILITIMSVNNEVGTIQNIKAIGETAREKNIIFHTDAVQAAGALKIDVKDLNVDLMSFSGHKIYAPKGVGALYIRKGVRIANLLDGGAQEKNKRGGTENVAAIAGFAKAFELATTELEENSAKLSELRDSLMNQILAEIPYARINGHKSKRLPNNVNISFEFIEGESILLMLDFSGYSCSSGSACTSGSLDPSHVLLAIGLPHEIAHGSLRVTFGKDSRQEHVDNLVKDLKEIVKKLRDMSPLYSDFLKNGRN